MNYILQKVKFYDLLQARFIENADMPKNNISLGKVYDLLIWSGINKQYRIEIINDLIEKGYLKRVNQRILKIAPLRKKKVIVC